MYAQDLHKFTSSNLNLSDICVFNCLGLNVLLAAHHNMYKTGHIISFDLSPSSIFTNFCSTLWDLCTSECWHYPLAFPSQHQTYHSVFSVPAQLCYPEHSHLPTELLQQSHHRSHLPPWIQSPNSTKSDLSKMQMISYHVAHSQIKAFPFLAISPR